MRLCTRTYRHGPSWEEIPLASSVIAIQTQMKTPNTPSPTARCAPVSVLVPVKNEQANIGDCIRSVLWANEIIVIDSQSTDETVRTAEALGARVVQFTFTPGQ